MRTDWIDLHGVLVRLALDGSGVPYDITPVSILDARRFDDARLPGESPEQLTDRCMDVLLDRLLGDDAWRNSGHSGPATDAGSVRSSSAQFRSRRWPVTHAGARR